MFFKRLSSRSRSNSQSQSYVDSYPSPHDSKANSASYDDAKYAAVAAADKYSSDRTSADFEQIQRPNESRQSNTAPQSADALTQDAAAMYPRSSAPTEVPPQSAGSYGRSTGLPLHSRGSGGMGSNSFANGGTGGYRDDADPVSPLVAKHEPAPDLLLQAFNQALRPYSDKVETLENEIADLRAYIDQLEGHRNEVHAWIDKRGLRPDVPNNIARQMDDASHSASPTHAASTLNAQLDRKITIVNFDLHRLQDDLNDSLPTPSFSACMLKFLPDIARLSSLPSGPRYAFDLLLKLGGNLNSHGGLENGDAEDLAERRTFYGRLDDAMVDVVRGRFREEGDSWGVQREIKRIEKTGAYLRNWGVEPYFPRTLDVMKEGSVTQSGAVGGGASAGSPGY